jgi:hypothetical protein
MHKIEFESGGRSMRWYEWLVGLFLLAAIAGVRAESVYKCVNAKGGISYQQVSCGAEQQQSTIAIAPAPRYAPSPHYVLARKDDEARPRSPAPAHERASNETAFECHVSDGRIFYRLSACPHSIAGAATASAAKSHRGKSDTPRNGGGSAQVSARRIPRDEACREIHRAGAIGRDGHDFDERVSSYEHNLGHDPCKS